MHLSIIYLTVDPHLFFTDPDPSFFSMWIWINADPDPPLQNCNVTLNFVIIPLNSLLFKILINFFSTK